jgi:nucleotide-binding universal stress UspA family protein
MGKSAKTGRIISVAHPIRVHRCLTDSAFAVICMQIEALDSDLVVIGKYGKSGLEDPLLGSVMKQVMQYADCDVLVVVQDWSSRLPRKIGAV